MIPIGTDRDGRRPAIAVLLIIALCVISFVAMHAGLGDRLIPREAGMTPIEAFLAWAEFDPRHVRWWQMFTSAFTHSPDDATHIIGNMVALWAFGKPVESHIGFWRFLLFYFAGIVVACGGHWLLSEHPAIGASGAVFAVTGLFAALFPRSHTKVLFLWSGLRVHLVPSMWMVAIWAIIDVMRETSSMLHLSASEVAGGAHLAGLAFGLVAGTILLAFNLVPRGEWDLLYLVRQMRRRAVLRAALRSAGTQPWTAPPAKPSASLFVDESGPLAGDTLRAAELRADIQKRLRGEDPAGALRAFRALLAIAPRSSFGPATQVDLANRALGEGDVATAVQAYENVLLAYPADHGSDELRLLLGMLLLRRVGDRARARALLDGLALRLHDPAQRTMATALLLECEECGT